MARSYNENLGPSGKPPAPREKTLTSPRPTAPTPILGNTGPGGATAPVMGVKPAAAPAPSITSPPRTAAPTPVPAAAPQVPPPAAPPPGGGAQLQGAGGGQVPAAGGAEGTGNPAYDDSQYRAQREAELTSALRAMESQFNLSREQLLADQTEAGDQYRFILSALQRSKEEAIANAQSGALQRGVLRSGIYLGDEAKVNQEFASQEASAGSDRAAKLNAIQMAIADLEGSFSQGVASGSSDIVQQQLAAMKEMANSLSLDDALGQRAAAAGYQATPPGAGGGLTGGAPGAMAGPTWSPSQFGTGTFGAQTGGPMGAGFLSTDRGAIQGTGGLDAQASGQAYYGQGVSPEDFIASLAPEVQAGITQQDYENLKRQYGNLIPPDAAFNIANRAALIGSRQGV